MKEELPIPGAASTPKKAPCLSTTLAIFLGIAFVVFALVGLIGFNIWRVLFNPTLLKQALTTEIVSSDLVPTFLEVFSEWRAEQRVNSGESLSGVNEPDVVLLLSYVDTDDWRQIKQLLVTDEFVTGLVSVSVDGIYHWLDSDELWPAFIWELTPLKSRLTGEQGVEGIMVAYSALPVCTTAEVLDLEQRLSEVPPGVEVLYNLCQFPAPWHDDQVSDYVEALNGIDENVPVRFDSSETLASYPPAAAVDPVQVKMLLRALRFIARWSWLIALALLLLVLGFGVRSRRSLGQFIGIPLAVTGMLAILIAWGGQVSIIQFVTSKILATTSTLVLQEVEGSLKHLTAYFFQPLLIQGMILAGLGLLLIIQIFIRKPQTKMDATTINP